MTSDPPPNCETCPNHKQGKYADTCNGILFQDHIDSADKEYIKDWVREHGCLSHPLSREWLNRDVIRELKQRQDEESDKYMKGLAYGFRMEAKGKNLALTEAIALLKEGVRK